MKPEIIKADTAGFMVKFPNDDDVYYVGEKVGSGYVYQDKQAFRDRVGVCYISEHGWLDEVGIDENVSDEMLTFIDEHGYCCVALDNGYTWNDLYDEVFNWIGSELDDVAEDVVDDFCCYMTATLFSNLVISAPRDIIEQFDVRNEYNVWLQTEVQDPRLTDKQRKELGYE